MKTLTYLTIFPAANDIYPAPIVYYLFCVNDAEIQAGSLLLSDLESGKPDAYAGYLAFLAGLGENLLCFNVFPVVCPACLTPFVQATYTNPAYNAEIPVNPKTNAPTLPIDTVLANLAVQNPTAYAGYLAFLAGLTETL